MTILLSLLYDYYYTINTNTTTTFQPVLILLNYLIRLAWFLHAKSTTIIIIILLLLLLYYEHQIPIKFSNNSCITTTPILLTPNSYITSQESLTRLAWSSTLLAMASCNSLSSLSSTSILLSNPPSRFDPEPDNHPPDVR